MGNMIRSSGIGAGYGRIGASYEDTCVVRMWDGRIEGSVRNGKLVISRRLSFTELEGKSASPETCLKGHTAVWVRKHGLLEMQWHTLENILTVLL